jgi:acid phosphatase family membrane protein YuiD
MVLKMGFLEKVVSNNIINLAVLSWFSAQALKVVVALLMHKKWDFKRFSESGGMPSSHSSTVCSITTFIMLSQGYRSLEFGLAFVFSMIVMYDAAGVRRAAGEQAKILNRIVKDFNKTNPKQLTKELKELLGHTKTEVFVGGLIGIIIAVVYWNMLK